MSLLIADQLTKTYSTAGLFRSKASNVSGISGISFVIEEGMCLGILGESGAGKSTIGKIILGLLRPDSGSVTFQGTNLYTSNRAQQKKWRRDLQVVFQDSYSAINPRMTVRQIIAEPLRNYERMSLREEEHVVCELLETVGLSSNDMRKTSKEMSGGQLQRVNIARAIALKPKLIVLDEPVSSLDMIVQKQILIHLNELKEKYGLSYLLISHDVLAVNFLSDHVAFVDGGKIVETIETAHLFNCMHPVSKRMVLSAF
ncbi:ABC transporter ATP-binding protein [Paenibacillus chitinolyticus]|uniref:ABC transporter ATP-binding protein n=1 Tax=Paenibacillus chitinolyticus TaxID=79263 RepID=A0A410WXW0_9BACL|nr:ABC transporter ATP-binding protein [Paenibacillus chitinolyticus]MCY9589894.1 ABC transporter ATP-binding protein [Paenibacillus chitinolyticus]MCY9596231.1 ABC transporter ATP-binding protein [Paenibacillus chitinolyticus]QAV19265.1 ABC transporter ATP-binding protein [Paenibacillus chitinolyticus]